MPEGRHKDSKISVVLIEPDIPQNTGNISRLCFSTGCELVMVRPFGFRLTDKGLERAGMDYWRNLKPLILDDLDAFFEWAKNRRLFYLSAHANQNYTKVKYQPRDVLVFGSESSGLPKSVYEHAQKHRQLITIPMEQQARCINVSSAVAASVFEALRQINNW